VDRAKPSEAGFYIALADAFRRLDDGPAAARHYRRALERDAANSTARLALAELLIARGANTEAVKILEAAGPSADPPVLNALAIARTGLGDYPAALAALNRALEVDSLLALTWLNKGIVLAATGQAEQAAAAWRQALQLDPDLARARELLQRPIKAP
jgi:tetratricopeptide (TPR) repeat protein